MELILKGYGQEVCRIWTVELYCIVTSTIAMRVLNVCSSGIARKVHCGLRQRRGSTWDRSCEEPIGKAVWGEDR